jgi:hypothetical protein
MRKIMKKPIYKIKFEVEVEITKELIKTRRGIDKIGYSPEMHINKHVLINAFDTSDDADKEFLDRCQHIEKHFSDRIRLCYGDMFHNEGSTLNIDSLDIKSQAREKVILETAQMENQMQRQRLPTKKGRNPDKSKKDYLADKERFINECVEIMKAIQEEGDRVTQLNLADMYFTDKFRTNPVKPLLQKLKLYGISWKELVAKIPNNLT